MDEENQAAPAASAEEAAARQAGAEPLRLPNVGGSWTAAELEAIALEARDRGLHPDIVAVERKAAAAQKKEA